MFSASAVWVYLFLSLLSYLVHAQGPVQTLFPAAIPLAVKTPYLNIWYESLNTSQPLSNAWPTVWIGPGLVAWAGLIRVNGTTYKWLGNDPKDVNISAKVTNVQITPTRSIFVMEAGPMNVTVTFLSPVEPDDWVKQSIPFSYVSVEAQSLDGNSYPVQMYSDISAEWETGDRTNSVVQWRNASTANSIYHQIWLQDPTPYSENTNQAQDGTTYYAMSTSYPHITSQMDFLSVTRNQFQQNGILTNAGSTAFTTNIPDFPVFALAVDLGIIKSTDSPVTWAVGLVRDPSILYTTTSGATQERRPYYTMQYTNVEDVIDEFTGDYAAAHAHAVTLDQKIIGEASKVHSSQYADIVALATRQTMGALEITVGTDSNNKVIPDDVMIFMKNMGTDSRANPVDHIYMAFPAFLYLNASLGGALLAPLLASQPGSLSGQTYAAQDLGNQYPRAPGPNGIQQQGVEQSGNMLIMMLAHARISGDGTLLAQNYITAKRWADYLVGNTLESQGQQNEDNGDASVLTNIALKGIIGVKAMAEIAHALGEDLDAQQYGDKASGLLSSFLSRATSSDGSRFLGSYGDQQSWSLMYNIFADKLLGLNFVPQSAIDMHTRFIASLVRNAVPMGLPIDSDAQQIANAAWTLFTSAFVSDNTVRDTMIESVYNHANYNLSSGVFSERYNVSTGFPRNGFASPAVGGTFSHLALTLLNKTISVDSTRESVPVVPQKGRSGNNTGVIVGGVIGGLAIVGIAVSVLLVLRRNRRRQYEAEKGKVFEQAPRHRTLTPYNKDDVPIIPRWGSKTAGVAHVRTGDILGAHQERSVDRPHPSSTIMAVVGDAQESAAMPRQRGVSSKSSNVSPNKMHRSPPPVGMMIPSSIDLQMGLASALSEGRSVSDALSPTDVRGLRSEVENLRQMMQEIRVRQFEPPPEYVEE